MAQFSRIDKNGLSRRYYRGRPGRFGELNDTAKCCCTGVNDDSKKPRGKGKSLFGSDENTLNTYESRVFALLANYS